jgi:hypothetical protein
LEKNVIPPGDKAGRFRQKRHFRPGTPLAQGGQAVNIRFTSSLTPEDENLLAPGLLNALASILDLLPIAYVIRIDTSDSQVYQHSGPGAGASTDPPAEPLRLGAGALTSFQAWADANRRPLPSKATR